MIEIGRAGSNFSYAVSFINFRGISDIHSVCTTSKVNLWGLNVSHDPGGYEYTCFLFKFDKKTEDYGR